jgi:hypothetical protein
MQDRCAAHAKLRGSEKAELNSPQFELASYSDPGKIEVKAGAGRALGIADDDEPIANVRR